jgi:KaiC/GvpD/RAD55 family RecA-like ATPase/GGDEF domain-containing protein
MTMTPDPADRLPVTGSARPADFVAQPPTASDSLDSATASPLPTMTLPADETDRIISGIDLIDYGVGGLYPDHVYVVKGGVGTGKSILGLQFLIRGLDLGEPGILITDQRPENIIAQARSLDLPVEEAIKRGQLVILNTSQRYFELVESPADVTAIMEELEDYIREKGTRRLVIDPIYSLINTTYSGHFALAIGQSLMNALEELPVTTLLVSGDDQNPELSSIERMLEQNAFGTVTLAPDPATGGRIMRLSRLRYANADHIAAHYRILNGRGLMNYQGEGERVADVTKPWDEPEIRRSVLLVGATPETVRKIEESLGSDYTIAAESDIERAVERVRDEKPGLVLVTPSRALQAMSAIAELSRNSSSSIAFLSPSANRSSDRILYLRAGADDFITQPFSAPELRARVEALVRRSGRRLTVRDSGIGAFDPQELQQLDRETRNAATRKTAVFTRRDGRRAFEPMFEERLRRNLDTVSKFDTNFALYWLQADDTDRQVNRTLARLCRQEDVLCHNNGGEFVAILTGTDANGVKGFESRMAEKLGKPLDVFQHGYALHEPGQPIADLPSRAFSA